MSFPIPSLNTLGSFVFALCRRQTNKQTNKQTDSKILPTPTEIVGVCNNYDNGSDDYDDDDDDVKQFKPNYSI